MISLKCSRCGREIEVSDAVRTLEIRCARCGQTLKPNPATEIAGTHLGSYGVGPFTPGDDADLDEQTRARTKDQSGDNDTWTPHDAPRTESFTFLSPPRDANELGWLGQYRIVRLLGQGGMGIVFEADDTCLQRTVALKVMKPEIAQDPAARQRFLREARAMAAVRHDRLTAIYHVGQEYHIPFMAMEFLQGEPLDKWLTRTPRPPLAEVVRIGIEMAEGLAAAHAHGLIHRDIKPANIWLESPGARVKILDFGLARTAKDRSHLTQRGIFMGTPAYMAPEQVESKEIDIRCDLFSFGCVLYEMVTGRQAFTGASSLAILMAVTSKDPPPPREINPAVPTILNDLIQKMLAKEPDGRPANATEVVATLQPLANPGIEPAPTLLVAPAPVVTGMTRRCAVVIGVLVSIAVIAVALAVWLAQ